MEIFTSIPFTCTFSDFSRKIGIERYDGMEKEIEILFIKTAGRLKPKALFRELFIDEKGEDYVTFGAQSFESRILRENLEQAERVFAYICTCGNELDIQISGNDTPGTIEYGDIMENFLVDEIKQLALDTAIEYLLHTIKNIFRIPKLISMNPGSGDTSVWPIRQQRPLFSLFGDTETSIGVRLTDSYLMVPNKTVSGILIPTETDFFTCQVCTRDNCPNRKAVYNGRTIGAFSHE